MRTHQHLVGHQPIIKLVPDILNRLRTAVIGPTNIFCIAGSAAVSYDLAEDIDVWVFAHGRTADDVSASFVNIDPIIPPNGDGKYITDEKIATLGRIELEGLKPIQLHATFNDHANELLDSFDVSTHCAAVMGSGHLVHPPYFTPPSVPPRILRVETPLTTMRRYFRICARYGFTPDWGPVKDLCALVAYEKYGNRPLDVVAKLIKESYAPTPHDNDEVPF